ncbi:MAG: TonB-dependent receptor [Mucilaginibacter polytrichastri]|nr:TonB-dependent receptor [Mucilaginibacter polytrichastri]
MNQFRRILPAESRSYRLLLLFCFCFFHSVSVYANVSFQSNIDVQGKVTDEKNEPLPGVSVKVKGAQTSAVTDANGQYKISAPENGTLVFTYVGFTTKEVAINNQTTVNAALTSTNSELDEVVVIGYQTIKKKDLTGAVSVVDTKNTKKVTATTVAESLQGAAPGVNVRNGGRPGQAPRVEIRGVGSIVGNDPLYVIDGLITSGSRDLNPNDVESIQVLKDASAAAIYGANAANGVIIVTTKKGKEGPLAINLSAKYGIQNVPKRWDLTNNTEFAALNRTTYENAGRTPQPTVSTAFDPSINTDWQDAILQTGSFQDYNMDLSGGSKNSTFLISGNYFKNNGTVMGTSFERISMRVNTEGKRGIFKIGENLQLSNAREDLMQGNPFYDMVRMLPTIPLYNPNNPGGYGYGSDNAYTFGTNPVAINNLIQDNQNNFRLQGNAYLEAAPLKWLTYKFNYGLETSFDHFTSLRKLGSWTYNQPVDPSYFAENRAQSLSHLIENTINFNHSFDKHNLNGVIGTSYRNVGYSIMNARKQDVTVASATGTYYPVLDAAVNNPQAGGSNVLFRTFSYFGRVNYDYDGRYLLSASLRRDQDSRFSEDFRIGYFPSVSAAWRLSKESFFDVPLISDLKLRGSYGELGTSNIPEYARFGNINLFPLAVFGTDQVIQNGATQTLLFNPSIRWETRKTTNIGLDLGLFEDALIFSAEYYNSTTRDVLSQPPLPQTTGNRGGDPYVNAASFRNTGVEFTATYRNQKREFKYDVSANVFTVKNRVLALGNLGEGITYIATGLTRTQIGQPLGSWFLYKSDGIFQNQAEVDAHGIQPFSKPGDIRYLDINGDGRLDNNDRTFVGSPWPTFQGGLNFNGSFKNFSISMQLYGSFGNKLFNGVRSVIDRFDDNSNYRRGIVPWTPENPNTDFPRIAYSGELGIQYNTRGDIDRWLEDGSYLRMRNLEIGYVLPQSLLQKLTVKNARVFVSGQNLFTITKYTGLDPDVVGSGFYERGHDAGNFPASRIFSFGLQCGF